jgi:cbb3-type cytochrome oxidase subunit 1/cytochrome c2
VTAETASNEPGHADDTVEGTGIARTHLIVAVVFLLLGLVVATIAAFQLVLPDLLSGIAPATYGRIAPASRALLGGWLVLGLLGGSYFAMGTITGSLKRSSVAMVSLAVIVIGTLAATAGILLGLGTGLSGLDAPIWARGISFVGYLLAAVSMTATARASKDRLGTTGWYLTAAPLWLTLSALAGLLPAPDGVAGNIQASFVDAGYVGLFVLTASVGLLYFVLSSISGTDPTDVRPLSTLGFWSLTLVWANMGAVPLIYSPAPDWYETVSVAFAIASLIPLLTIAGDLALMLRGRLEDIADRASLRYAIIAGLSMATLTVVNLLLAWRATSAIAQFSMAVSAFDLLVVVGAASCAIFSVHSFMKGGASGRPSVHFVLTAIGLIVVAGGLVTGAVVVGFSWAAGPASQAYANVGPAWKVTADSSTPFLWIAALGLAVVTLGQLVYAATFSRSSDEELAEPPAPPVFDLEFEGPPRYATWGRLMGGVALVWLFALLMTAVLPILDPIDGDATILADTFRTYEEGTEAFTGRNLYISEGCIECHTQQVRPIGTDVGLGTVSLAGDYANESPALLGVHRFGPDLMHFASSGEFFDKVIVSAHLTDPRSVVPWSTMPSYSYLSDDDITALVAYIETLR